MISFPYYCGILHSKRVNNYRVLTTEPKMLSSSNVQGHSNQVKYRIESQFIGQANLLSNNLPKWERDGVVWGSVVQVHLVEGLGQHLYLTRGNVVNILFKIIYLHSKQQFVHRLQW